MGLISMVVIAIAIALKCNKRISETLAFSLLSILLSIYCLGLLDMLQVSVYVICGFAGISLLYCIYALFIRKVRLNNIFNPELLAFILYVVFFLFYSYGRDFKSTDEFRTWGAMVKNFYYFDKFIDADMHFAGVGDYPPGSALWLYFLNKTWISFSDSICIFGNAIFVISLLLPVIGKIKKDNRVLYYFISLIILLLLPIVRDMRSYLTITPDALITGIICYFIYCMMEYMNSKDRWYFIADIICLASLCVTKNSGIVFSSLLIIVYCYLMIKNNNFIIVESAILVIVSIISYSSWYGIRMYCIVPIVSAFVPCGISYFKNKLEKNLDKNVVVAIIVIIAVVGRLIGSIDIDRITYNTFTNQVIIEHLYSLFSFDLFEHTVDDYIVFPYSAAVLGLLLIFVYFNKLFKRGKQIHREALFIVAIVMFFYDIIMFIMQLFVIGPGMNYMAHTPDRYMTPLVIVAFYLIIYIFISSEEISGVSFGIISLVLILCIVNIKSFAVEVVNKYQCIGYYALEIGGITPGIGDKIFYVDEEYNYEYRDLEFAYYFMPASTNDVETKIGRLQYSVDELEDVLADGYDYLYIQTCSDDFLDRYGELFANSDNVTGGQAYYVENIAGKVRLLDVSK